MIIHHGDVIFVKVDKIPKKAEKEKDFKGIVQFGEKTGHAHRLSGKGFEMFQHFEEGRRYLRLKKETPITHEEHHEIKIPPGEYEVRIVREVDHFQDLVRTVVD